MVGDDQSDSELALAELTAIIKATTTTMTSVPKPFKFLKTYYKDIVDYMLNLFDSDHKVLKPLTVEKRCGFLVSAINDLR